MPVEQVVATARKAADAGATEVHIVGGLHPWLKFDYYLDMLRGIRAACPDLHIKAFTAIEIIHFSRIARLSVAEVLAALREAGLGSMPGGGAEIFDDRVHDEVFKGKVRADKWFDVHRTAHRLGIYSNATMLYGHVEEPRHRVDHLIRLRELQDETGGFQTFIPLAFHPDNTPLHHIPKTTGFDDLKSIAVARLMLDNIDHIKAYWIMMTPKIAQIAQRFGSDDLDGTVVEEKIYHDAGATTSQSMRRGELLRLIREAGREPLERDTLYRPVVRTESLLTVLD
jgi:aminodeoxyfutalosine synthase